ncbi:hypothetical protein [Halomarina pelagica]|uniref:hypothetical protein n=1 Tax=Halomarina pelagica TaxID=2961599 RepID=UPI0020C2F47F|nr:hypothetical protein [Halomarina sp. BND7]
MGYAILAGPEGITLRGSGDLIGAHFPRIDAEVRRHYDLRRLPRTRHVGYARVDENDDLDLALFDTTLTVRV